MKIYARALFAVLIVSSLAVVAQEAGETGGGYVEDSYVEDSYVEDAYIDEGAQTMMHIARQQCEEWARVDEVPADEREEYMRSCIDGQVGN
jgi:hypothetical protein